MVVDDAFASRGAVVALSCFILAPVAPVGARCAAPRDKTRPIVLVPHRAIYDLSLGQHARQFAGGRRPRPHPLRFRRQCLRGLFAGIPPGLRARHRRRQSIDQRFALDDLGRRRRQEFQIHVAEFCRSKTWSIPSTAMPSTAPTQDRRRSRQAASKRASISTPAWYFRPSTWCG